ncbi:hypothetical protein IWX76_002093 [Pedobacter sp. CAN_A7]|uniref:hypothetical protein n=1 Tax=Pedobacter sp. CAN_A7 TaxID=2787722 RepID=UPI0018C91617
MKNHALAFIALSAVLTACQQKPNNPVEIDSVAEEKKLTGNVEECYTYIKNRDTVALTMSQVGTAITGRLTYKLFEKDKNEGRVVGKIKGDTLLLDYTFASEGTTSQRPVAFLKQDDQLIEGFGPAETRKYDTNGIVLEKIACQ